MGIKKMNTVKFEEMRSPQIKEFSEKNGVVLVPIGATEEHARHLPVMTDTKIAYQACLDAAEIAVLNGTPTVVLPPVYYGYTVGVLKNWAGTITIRPKVLIDFMYDICKSLIDMHITRILIVNGHGNNPGVLDVVVRSIGDDYKVFPGVIHVFGLWDKDYVRANRASPEGGIGHAGEIETSVMLHLCEELVDMTVADDTDIMKSSFDSCPVDFASLKKKQMFLSAWYLENPTYGGNGDPSGARSEFGQAIHEMAVRELAEKVKEFTRIHKEIESRKLNRADTRF